MKTDKSSETANTREGHLSQSELERTVPTTNRRRKYEIMLSFTQYSYAKVIIQATSLAAARRKANAMKPDLMDDFKIVDGQISVDWVEPVEGGQGNE